MNFSSVLLFGLILFEFARNKRKSKVKYIRTTKSQPMKCVGEDGRTDGWAYGHVMTKISHRMGRLPHFLTYGYAHARLVRAWSSTIRILLGKKL